MATHWILTTGVVCGFGLLVSAYQYINTDTMISYVGPTDAGYKFKLANTSPSPEEITSFRVRPILSNSVLYETTQPVIATLDSRGRVHLPDGNSMHVPAYQFNDADGSVVPEDGSIEMTIPKLAAERWLRPVAVDVDVKYYTSPTNQLYAILDNALSHIGFVRGQHINHFVVVHDYWFPVPDFNKDAINHLCQSDDHLQRTFSLCSKV